MMDNIFLRAARNAQGLPPISSIAKIRQDRSHAGVWVVSSMVANVLTNTAYLSRALMIMHPLAVLQLRS